ncbi:hypothetical protein N7463_003871 [Penicillium fimorum]|uniref:Uncharacterized protein n=1 Tax=Penicillium fimorum TaxID=1882269 RepID=A0A9W9Y3G4_9EURO|nr:hypothetical protein N7463_003871 [Penicillium fimorum]
MQYKVLATLFFAATALAAPADSTETTDSDGTFDLQDVPSSIMSVLATAVPESWYNDLLDPTSLSSIESAVAAGTYPAWYNALPSDVKSWATEQLGAGLVGGASATADSSATQTKPAAGSSAIETGSSLVPSTAGQTSSNAAETPSASSTSGSSSDSASSSASPSPSSSQSTGGAPAPTGGVAMGVAGAAGILALALAL